MINRRQHNKQVWTPGEWVVTALIIILTIKVVGYFTLIETNIPLTRVLKILIRCTMTSLTVGIYYYLVYRATNIRIQLRHSAPLVFYLSYMLLAFISLTWSTNFGRSLIQWFMYMESVVFVFFYYKLVMLYNTLAPENQRVRMSTLLSRSSLWVLSWMLIGVIVAPEVYYRLTHGGEVARLGGEKMNPNELGMLAVIGISMSFMELKFGNRKVMDTLIMLVCLIALIMTSSRSSMIGVFIVGAYFVYHSKSYWIKAVSVVGAALAVPVVFTTIFVKQGDLEEVMSLTGRLPFWKALLSEGFPESPIWGFGFMRISHFEKFYSLTAYAGGMTHNTFLQVLMNLGLVGLFIVFCQMVSTLWAFFTHKDLQTKMLCCALFIPILINSFTEFGIFGESNYGVMYYQFIIFILIIEATKMQTWQERMRLKKQQ